MFFLSYNILHTNWNTVAYNLRAISIRKQLPIVLKSDATGTSNIISV